MAQVFVVERADFFGGVWAQGFVPMAGAQGDEFLERAYAAGRFVERELAERTPRVEAVDPLLPAALRRVNPDGNRRRSLFCPTHQGTVGGKAARASLVGLGGHVEPQDDDQSPGVNSGHGRRFFAESLARELTEELHIKEDTARTASFLGLLNDDSTAVGSVHAGLVYAIDLPMSLDEARNSVHVREISKMSGGFGSLVEFRILWQDRSRFETWSQLLVDAGAALLTGPSSIPQGGGHRRDP
jgi:predicted NUDIX family phosphoesterase